MKALYIVLSLSSLGLLFGAAPRGAWLAPSPDRGKVERRDDASPTGRATVRRHNHFVFIGGYQGGK